LGLSTIAMPWLDRRQRALGRRTGHCAAPRGAARPSILGLAGVAPVHETLIGSVESLGEAGVAKWKAKLRELGAGGG
jgi:hypothetical protein